MQLGIILGHLCTYTQNNSKLQRLPKRSYFIPISYQVGLLGPFWPIWMFRRLWDGIRLRHCGIDIIAGIVSGSKMRHGFAQLRLSISWAWWFLAAIAHIEAVWIPLPCLDRAPATCSFRSYDFLWAVAETLEKQPYRQPRLFFLPSTTARAGMTAPLGYKGLGYMRSPAPV